jgi:hypothetical protein
MDLREFIKQTLEQIVGGIADAQKSCAASGHSIAPKDLQGPADGRFWDFSDGRIVEPVNFDVAVTVASASSGGGKAGIDVAGLVLGGGGEVSGKNASVSRIKFRTFVVLPAGEVQPPTLRDVEIG